VHRATKNVVVFVIREILLQPNWLHLSEQRTPFLIIWRCNVLRYLPQLHGSSQHSAPSFPCQLSADSTGLVHSVPNSSSAIATGRRYVKRCRH